jgi:putative thioredoxin
LRAAPQPAKIQRQAAWEKQMNAAPYKFSATDADFATVVVAESTSRPVLVDFWAPWCGPCQTLMPLLDRIADDYGGRFALAKVNTDEEQQVAGQFGIRSIPTVMLFHQGKAVEQFVGVQPESAIRALLDKYLAPAGDGGPDTAGQFVAQVESALEARDVESARAALRELEATRVDHPALPALRALTDFAEAAIARPDVPALRAALEQDPADLASRHALAAHHALAGDYATALSEWLEVLRRDRRYGDDLARRSILAAFDVLGEGHELTASYRRRMASLLH